MNNLILDGTKIQWYPDRVRAWSKGERIAPVTIDMALTRACNYKCIYCYGQLQENKRERITKQVMTDFLEDIAEIGVKGLSLVSDGESTLSPAFIHTIDYGNKLGLSLAVGTNGYALDPLELTIILPSLTYLRFNISAATKERYNQIMRPPKDAYDKIIDNIKTAIAIRDSFKLPCTIGMQMVLMPEFIDQVIPLAELAKELKVDYLLIKHCSDDENSSLGVNYDKYEALYPTLWDAESLSTTRTKIVVKWSKIKEGNKRSYTKCYGPPFILQISGSGLVAPCGMLFNDKYKRFHIGNIARTRFKELWTSDNYWRIMRELASDKFNAQTMCGCLCLQHNVCKFLDNFKKGRANLNTEGQSQPNHLAFI